MTSKPIYILIDGYNLLFQSNLVGKSRGPGWLEKSRARLTKLLVSKLPADQLGSVQIVFDASQSRLSRPSSSNEATELGIRILFADEHPEADDLLEQIIRAHPHPKTLRVVSSDNRIRRCARAKRAQSVTAEQFLDELEYAQPKREAATGTGMSESPELAPADSPDDSPDNSTDVGDVDYWLKKFTTTDD